MVLFKRGKTFKNSRVKNTFFVLFLFLRVCLFCFMVVVFSQPDGKIRGVFPNKQLVCFVVFAFCILCSYQLGFKSTVEFIAIKPQLVINCVLQSYSLLLPSSTNICFQLLFDTRSLSSASTIRLAIRVLARKKKKKEKRKKKEEAKKLTGFRSVSACYV